MSLIQTVLHYAAHWIAPALFARLTQGRDWLRHSAVMLSANLIDLDHLLADPVFDPGRCSIGFHPLHGAIAAGVYLCMLVVPRWWMRAFGLGALWHLAVDYGDCLMQG